MRGRLISGSVTIGKKRKKGGPNGQPTNKGAELPRRGLDTRCIRWGAGPNDRNLNILRGYPQVWGRQQFAAEEIIR